jgi:hypothetical protein
VREVDAGPLFCLARVLSNVGAYALVNRRRNLRLTLSRAGIALLTAWLADESVTLREYGPLMAWSRFDWAPTAAPELLEASAIRVRPCLQTAAPPVPGTMKDRQGSKHEES